MATKPKFEVHPAVWDLQSSLYRGKLSRREFIRYVTLLGTSMGAATVMSACGSSGTPESYQTVPTPGLQTAIANGIRRGGTWICGMQVQQIDHPAHVVWGEQVNLVRQIGEYLTEIGPDNFTRPYLLDRWETNQDLTEWTLYLKKGITFNNGSPLQADDVLFTFGQWFDESVGSSMAEVLSSLDGLDSVEKIDDYTIRLHLNSPNIAISEHLAYSQAIILHRHFEGDFIKQPIGTGPFMLAEFTAGERAKLKRRSDYWQIGGDGQALPYLDELIYHSLHRDQAVEAMQTGQIDTLFQPRPDDWVILNKLPEFTVRPIATTKGFIIRMRVDVEPWTDVRVRNALKLCLDRTKILDSSHFGEGDLSIDAHVAPSHPEYCEKPIPEYNPELAKQLLIEAGYPEGFPVNLVTKNDEAEPAIAQALKDLAAPAGFDIRLDITEPAGYWERWKKVGFGITAWDHRPLGTMNLALAYGVDRNGQPGQWNETGWVDEEFLQKLRQAEATLDVEERRKIMCEIEEIQITRGPIANAYWRSTWNITRSQFQNIYAHPTGLDYLNRAWKS